MAAARRLRPRRAVPRRPGPGEPAAQLVPRPAAREQSAGEIPRLVVVGAEPVPRPRARERAEHRWTRGPDGLVGAGTVLADPELNDGRLVPASRPDIPKVAATVSSPTRGGPELAFRTPVSSGAGPCGSTAWHACTRATSRSCGRRSPAGASSASASACRTARRTCTWCGRATGTTRSRHCSATDRARACSGRHR